MTARDGPGSDGRLRSPDGRARAVGLPSRRVAAAPEPGPARKGSLAFPPSSRSAPSGADHRCRLAINVTVRRGANGSDPAGKHRRTVGRSPPCGRRLQRRLSGDPARSARSGDHRPLERGEIAPSIGVARKLAEALGVTLDDLVGENELATLRDKAMLERWQTFETLPAPDQERILFVLDSLMRDAKTRQAYQASA